MTYDEKADGEGSYLAAIAAKKARGDDYYLLPHQDFRLLRSVPEGVSSLVGRYLSAQRFNQRSGRSFAHRAVNGPGIGHQDFCCLLDGGDVPDDASVQDFDGRLEPSSADHGGILS